MIKLCIFDLDGTLIDSLDDLVYSINRAMKLHGLPPRSNEEVQFALGMGVDYLVKSGIPQDAYTDELHGIIRSEHTRYYKDHCTVRTRPYEGIIGTLQQLHDMGVKLAISTNKPHAFLEKIMHDLLACVQFAKIAGAGEYPHKPDPTAVLGMMAENEVLREECLYIGDTDVDIATARNAGVTGVGVTWGFRSRDELEKAGANYIINKPEELIDLVESMEH